MMVASTISPNLTFKKPSFIHQWHKMNFQWRCFYPVPQKSSSLPFLHHHHHHLIKNCNSRSTRRLVNTDDGGPVDSDPQNSDPSENFHSSQVSFLELKQKVSELKKKGFNLDLGAFADEFDENPQSPEVSENPQPTFADNLQMEEKGFSSDGDEGSDDESSEESDPYDPAIPHTTLLDYIGVENNGLSSDGGSGAVEVDENSQHPFFHLQVQGITRDETPVRPQLSFQTMSSSSRDVALLVRTLGIDSDPRDRELAVDALWTYSQGGNQRIDAIMQFDGCIGLIVNLLKSDSSLTCKAAAGLLGTISSVNLYRDAVAESGAIEELTGLLSRSSLTAEVKEQILCTLWNLSADEKFRMKIANVDILPTLVKALDAKEVRVKEAAGSLLANLALSPSNHQIMVEAGVIPKLAKLLIGDLKDEQDVQYEQDLQDVQESKVIRKKANNALLEFTKDEFYRILIVEEGLVLVPIIGADAYKCFKVSNSGPSIPCDTEFEQPSTSSRSGTYKKAYGLIPNIKNLELDEALTNAIEGRSWQEFLALSGAIEMEYGRNPQSESLTTQHNTLLPWVDGVARLVLILQLEDASAISRAAQSIADASINEHMRSSFMVAGAVTYLVRLLNHKNEDVRLSACIALERLSVSNNVCHEIETEDGLHPLICSLKNAEMPADLLEKTMNILARILDPGKEMKSKVSEVDGSEKALNATQDANVIEGLTEKPDETKLSIKATRECLLDSAVISRLIEILKTSSPNLQTKAACILEYIAIAAPCIDTIIASNIESGLDAVFQQRVSNVPEEEDDLYSLQPELSVLEVEEAGLAISAASRLFAKLLDYEQFRNTINSSRFMQVLRRILKSYIPLQHKDWVAASLIKLQSSSVPHLQSENPINMEVILYETIPRLLEQITISFSQEAQETAVVELNTIISKGVVDFSRAVAAQGGIFSLVKVMEEGSSKAVEASLAILFNLSMDSENHSAIIAAGAVPILKRIVLSEGPQWTLALRLLWTLPTR